MRIERILANFIESDTIEERLTASRALFDLIYLNNQWAQEVVYTLASSLHDYQREKSNILLFSF
ncbi:MAG: hypothetical protein K0M45_05650 [Candidatus Paracaedibacteraceae bacterium]|nr:hypothetical protein [Candidatus Paracaedibacteraceae bacterium]